MPEPPPDNTPPSRRPPADDPRTKNKLLIYRILELVLEGKLGAGAIASQVQLEFGCHVGPHDVLRLLHCAADLELIRCAPKPLSLCWNNPACESGAI